MSRIHDVYRISSEPKDIQTKTGTKFVTFSAVISYVSGQAQQSHFIHCKAFGKTAELVLKYFKKGKPVTISGRMITETWEKDGTKHYADKVMVERLGFVPKDTTSKDEVPTFKEENEDKNEVDSLFDSPQEDKKELNTDILG